MEKYKEMLEIAHKTMENAYAPYSHFRVGSCVKTKDGQYFVGANIENASYSLTNCAERNAIFQAYSNGYRQEDIEAIVVVGRGKSIIMPCGACRQVLVELLQKDTPIILETEGQIVLTNIEELMPRAFTKEDL